MDLVLHDWCCGLESLGLFPEQLMFMLFVLLEKPAGGFRAILLAPGFVRMWQRLRRPALRPFMTIAARDYWAFGKGRSAEKTVWVQAVRAEAAKGLGGDTGGFVRDGKKYYESFCLERLRVSAYQHGIHPVIVKMCYNYWRGPRILRVGSHHSPRFSHALCGLPAGDVFADAFVMAYALGPFDRYIVRNPAITFRSYVDDNITLAFGGKHRILSSLKAASNDFNAMMRDELFVGIAVEKSFTIASDKSLARDLQKAFGTDIAGTTGCTAIALGADLAPGSRGKSKGQSRLACMKLRAVKVKRFTRALPCDRSRMRKILITGLRPAVGYGACINAIAPRDLKAIQRVLLDATPPSHGAAPCVRDWRFSVTLRPLLPLPRRGLGPMQCGLQLLALPQPNSRMHSSVGIGAPVELRNLATSSYRRPPGPCSGCNGP